MALQPRSCIGVLPVNRRAKDGFQKSALCPAFAGGVVGVGPGSDADARQPYGVAVADRAGRFVVGSRSPHGDDLVARQGILDDFDDYYYFLASLGRKIEPLATRLFQLLLLHLPLGLRLIAACSVVLAASTKTLAGASG